MTYMVTRPRSDRIKRNLTCDGTFCAVEAQPQATPVNNELNCIITP